MRKIALFVFVSIFVLSLAACGGGSGPEKSAEAYLTALVNADADRMSTLSCADWEMNAQLELDSFQAVEASLQDMSCSQTGEDGEIALVTCDGQIVTTYNDEQSQIELNSRTYEMVKAAGEWVVCGYR